MYTVEPQGNRWIASSGEKHVEDDSPEGALLGLLALEEDPELVESLDDAAHQLEDAIGKHALELVRMLATRAPAEVIRGTLNGVVHNTEDYLERME